jgi:glycosyltransferase involved in cell wall biosynthesis
MSDSELEVLLLAGRFEVRGSCAYTLRLAGGLAQQGISARVVSPDARLVNAPLRERLHVDEFRRLDTPIVGEFARRLVLRDARRQMPQLLHVQSHRAARLGIWLSRRLQRPYVLTMHEHLEDGARLPIDRRHCRGVIAVSESVRDDLARRWYVPPELLTVISSGVDAAVAGDLPPPLSPGRVPVIGTAGPLEAIKGFPYFLGAARQVLSVRSEVEFLVAGAGPEEANLRRVARELGISHKVTFVPYMLCFSEALAATDIFCLPSLQQGLGTIMLEAMAMGRPVIATGVGGVSSVIRHGETGLIVPPQNSGELARRILELLDQPARARAIGARARQLVVDEYNVDTMVRQTIDLYRSVVTAVPLPQLIERPSRAGKA